MPFTQPDLPYAENALEPVLSEREVKLHYGKHTKKYFDTLNELIKGTIYERVSDLEDLVTRDYLAKMPGKMYNNACQAWNHTFYWNCLTPETKSTAPSDALMKAIELKWDSFDKFKEEFTTAAIDHFGSGWAWLVVRETGLLIKTTPNARNPLSDQDMFPLLTFDVWEHAYLYDEQYAADRGAYVKNLWKLVNWDFVNEQYEKGRSNG